MNLINTQNESRFDLKHKNDHFQVDLLFILVNRLKNIKMPDQFMKLTSEIRFKIQYKYIYISRIFK